MNQRASDGIRLFAFGTGWGVPFATAAPFPLKLAAWLRMADVPFAWVEANNPGKGPKGKSPWIAYGDVRMGDSTLIIEHLSARYGVDLDAHLDAGQRALATSVQRMLEEHYHQCFEHQLFFGRGGAERLAEFAKAMPIPLRWLVPTVLKRAFGKQLYARGMGRHADDVIIAQGKADLDALAALLGEGPYFFGERPSTLDACIFGFLGVSLYVAGDNPLYRYAASLPQLVRYTERLRAQLFPESLAVRPALDAGAETRRSEGRVAAAAQPAKAAMSVA
ncbi:MAG: glutathione S-transferase family protein [Deltaproteobacteria bacterium]|nr:MAG: glutathione S-transferase family protein [Deltaproteobacteria bacterium]